MRGFALTPDNSDSSDKNLVVPEFEFNFSKMQTLFESFSEDQQMRNQNLQSLAALKEKTNPENLQSAFGKLSLSTTPNSQDKVQLLFESKNQMRLFVKDETRNFLKVTDEFEIGVLGVEIMFQIRDQSFYGVKILSSQCRISQMEEKHRIAWSVYHKKMSRQRILRDKSKLDSIQEIDQSCCFSTLRSNKSSRPKKSFLYSLKTEPKSKKISFL